MMAFGANVARLMGQKTFADAWPHLSGSDMITTGAHVQQRGT